MSAIPTSQKKPFIPAPGVLQVEMIYSLLGQIVENVYHVQVGSGGTPATETEMDSLAATMENWESVTGRGDRTNACVLTLIRVRRLDVAGDLVKEYTPVSPVTGSGTGGAAPGNVTVAIRWSTGQGGRSNRGRTYFIGMPVNFLSGNQLTSAAQTQIAASYAGLLSGINGTSGLHMGVLSFAHNKFWRNTAQFTPITHSSVEVNLDSQRRRLNGRGN